MPSEFSAREEGPKGLSSSMIRALANIQRKPHKFRGNPTRRQLLLSIGLVFVVGAAGFLRGQDISREYPLKAAFLYNFGGYVEWPAGAFSSAQAPVVIGVAGSNPFGTALDGMAATKKIRGRPIVVKYSVQPSEVPMCHILFISNDLAEDERLAVVDATRSKHVLVVGESTGMAQNGAVANFFIEQNKVRFEINSQAARERQLKISSKLMSLARVVDPDGVAEN
jgi:hypothetical protein